MVPKPTLIYHITHVNNLPSIIAADGLHCCGGLKKRKDKYVNIAHDTIQDRRAATNVPCGAGGNLHDYVPFYFAPRSPMLCAISHGNVASFGGNQAEVIHLVGNAQAVVAAKRRFVFSDGHGIMTLTDFYDDLNDLGNVDWSVMPLRYWNDTLKDPDRKRRRNAEFLVHDFFPWNLVELIGTMTPAMAAKVQKMLLGARHVPDVQVRADWYY